MNEVTINKKKEGFISKYNKAVETAEKSAWNLAKVVYETVNDETFKEVFGTIEMYALELNVSKASISKYAKAYERKLLIDASDYTLTQIAEFSSVPMEETNTFIELEVVTPNDTCKEIREKAKDYMKSKEVTENEESGQPEENEESGQPEENEEKGILTVSYNNTEYQVINEEIKVKILELLEILK